jgi:hypothetical protein
MSPQKISQHLWPHNMLGMLDPSSVTSCLGAKKIGKFPWAITVNGLPPELLDPFPFPGQAGHLLFLQVPLRQEIRALVEWISLVCWCSTCETSASKVMANSMFDPNGFLKRKYISEAINIHQPMSTNVEGSITAMPSLHKDLGKGTKCTCHRGRIGAAARS